MDFGEVYAVLRHSVSLVNTMFGDMNTPEERRPIAPLEADQTRWSFALPCLPGISSSETASPQLQQTVFTSPNDTLTADEAQPPSRRRHTLAALPRGSPPTYGQTMARDIFSSTGGPSIARAIPPPAYTPPAQSSGRAGSEASAPRGISPTDSTSSFNILERRYLEPSSTSAFMSSSSLHSSAHTPPNDIPSTDNTDRSSPRTISVRGSQSYANYPGAYGGFGGMSESQSRRDIPFNEEDGDPELPTYEREDKYIPSLTHVEDRSADEGSPIEGELA